jgi:hypothetical protein
MAIISETSLALFKQAISLIGLIFNFSIIWVTIKNKFEKMTHKNKSISEIFKNFTKQLWRNAGHLFLLPSNHTKLHLSANDSYII